MRRQRRSYAQALEAGRRVLGEENPGTPNTLGLHRGRVAFSSQKYTEAEAALRDASEKYEKARPAMWGRLRLPKHVGREFGRSKEVRRGRTTVTVWANGGLTQREVHKLPPTGLFSRGKPPSGSSIYMAELGEAREGRRVAGKAAEELSRDSSGR